MAVASRWYVRRWRAAAIRGSARRRHVTAFASGVTLLVVAMAGPLDAVGEERLMSVHMVQHMILMCAVPALLLAAFPAALLPPPPRRARSPFVPLICLAFGAGTIWLLHVPAVLDPALDSPVAHDTQHVLLVIAGALLAWPLSASGPLTGMGGAAYVVGAELAIGVLGIWLAWFPEVVYDSYGDAPRTLGLSAQTDQALAGAILLVVEEPFLAIEFVVLFIRGLAD